MSGIRSLSRSKTVKGYATGASAPIYVDSDDNLVKLIPAGSGTTEKTLVDTDSAQVLTNKTIGTPAAVTDAFTISGSADATKLIRFEVDGVTAGQTRVITPPDEDFTIVGVATAQTLTTKTLTNPVVNAAAGTIVVPTAASPAQTVEGSVVWDSDDDLLTVGDGAARKTMVDLAGTQVLTNKTLTAAVLTNPKITGQTPKNETTSPITFGTTHVGRLTTLNLLTGAAFTLPAATGSGDVYRLTPSVTITSGTLTVKVANAQDYMRGFALLANDTDGSASNFETANTGTVATESDTMTMNRTTTGIGTIGDMVECEDIAANIWFITVRAQANGTEATPFTVTV